MTIQILKSTNIKFKKYLIYLEHKKEALLSTILHLFLFLAFGEFQTSNVSSIESE